MIYQIEFITRIISLFLTTVEQKFGQVHTQASGLILSILGILLTSAEDDERDEIMRRVDALECLFPYTSFWHVKTLMVSCRK